MFLFIADSLALDFVNTEVVSDGKRVDLLTSLVAWSREAGIIDAAQARTLLMRAHRLDHALELRAAMRAGAERLAHGQPVADRTIRVLNRWMARTEASELRRSGDGFELHTTTRFKKPDDLLAPIALSFAELLTSDPPALVRECESETCILFFRDVSKAHRRRWCSMTACGNRAKAAAYYDRKRSEERRPPGRRRS